MSWSPSAGGVPGRSARGLPPLPPLRAFGARCWEGGSPPPPPPPRPLALGASCRLGVPLVTVRPLSGPRAPRARWGTPSGSRSPPCGGFYLWASWGSPPSPFLRAIGACCWVRVLPLPFLPLWPPTLGARDHSGGALSSVSTLAESLSSRALLGVLSPPSSLCVCSLADAGPTLTVPPAGAAGSAPMVCAVGCPAPPSLYLSVGAVPAVTGPPTAVDAAAPVGCAFGCPAPPARSSFPIYASASFRLVPLRCAAPSPPSGGRSMVGWAVVGFSSLPPRPRPSSPRWDRDTVGAPRVSTPLGTPYSLGVESSHDDSTPPPFVCGVELSCHDSTPLLPPLGVKLSWDDSTPPASGDVPDTLDRNVAA